MLNFLDPCSVAKLAMVSALIDALEAQPVSSAAHSRATVVELDRVSPNDQPAPRLSLIVSHYARRPVPSLHFHEAEAAIFANTHNTALLAEQFVIYEGVHEGDGCAHLAARVAARGGGAAGQVPLECVARNDSQPSVRELFELANRLPLRPELCPERVGILLLIAQLLPLLLELLLLAVGPGRRKL